MYYKRYANNFISNYIYKIEGMYNKAIDLDPSHPIKTHWGVLTDRQIDDHINEQEDMLLLLNEVIGDTIE
jgi:hypothetical protein